MVAILNTGSTLGRSQMNTVPLRLRILLRRLLLRKMAAPAGSNVPSIGSLEEGTKATMERRKEEQEEQLAYALPR